MMKDYTGQQFGNYRLVRLLGQGGFASVYLGQHVRIAAQQVAIKVLHLFDVDAQKFQNEAETTATLEHPHIVRLFDFHIEQGTPVLVMAYAPNGSLRTRHASGTQVPLASVVQYVKEIASALQYAHEQNIIHRDIKPENMLIGRHGELLLSDFGISVLSKTGRTTFQPTSYGVGGTALYMAPEQFRGKPQKASDQYALGIAAYEWFCGTTPFAEGDFIQLGYQHTHEPIPALRDHLPSLSPHVEAVVMRALAKKPGERFPSVREFAEALEAALQRLLATAGPHALEQPTTTLVEKPLPEDALPQEPKVQKPEVLSHVSDENVIWSSNCESLAWSPDGTHLSVRSGQRDEVVIVFDVQTKSRAFICKPMLKSKLTFLPDPTYTTNVAWSPDGKYITSEQYNEIWVCDATTGHYIAASNINHPVYAVAWSHDSKYIALAGHTRNNGGVITILDALTCRPIPLHFFYSHRGALLSIDWSPDDHQIASGGADKIVQVWNVANGRDVLTYNGHTDAIVSLSWSPDGTCIASGSWDQTVQVWDTTVGNNILTYSGHSAKVQAIAWSPSGTYLASGSWDQTIQIWNAITGSRVSTYHAYSKHVTCVAWSPDSTYLAAGSWSEGKSTIGKFGNIDSVVQIWAWATP